MLQAEGNSEVFQVPEARAGMGEPIDMQQSGCLDHGPTYWLRQPVTLECVGSNRGAKARDEHAALISAVRGGRVRNADPFGVVAAKTRPRGALIGNANYPDASTPLSTTIRDARTLADEFRRTEFDVDLKENAGKEDMRRAIDAFIGKIRTGMVALFYFSGYRHPGRAADLSRSRSTRRSGPRQKFGGTAISIERVLAEMQRKGAKVKIVILDASRRNPFERRFRASAAGLAALDAPEGTLAMYSAAPGKVINDGTGPNSLFVSELIKEMRVPNLTAEEVFNRARIGVSRASNNEQVPWVASSLVDEFYFGSPRPVATAPICSARAIARHPHRRRRLRPPPAPPAAPTHRAPTPAPAATATAPISHVDRPIGRSRPSPATLSAIAGTALKWWSCPPVRSRWARTTEYENPPAPVKIRKPFAIGRHEVTFDEWDACVEDGGCKHRPDDREWGRGDRPVINVSWLDAKEFVAWLSQKTGTDLPAADRGRMGIRRPRRREYALLVGPRHRRAPGAMPRMQGRATPSRHCRSARSRPNPFGLYDTAGNAAEWVEDCWNDNYRGAPHERQAMGHRAVPAARAARRRVRQPGAISAFAVALQI